MLRPSKYDGWHCLKHPHHKNIEDTPEHLPLWGVNHQLAVSLGFFDLNDGLALIRPAIQTGVMRQF